MSSVLDMAAAERADLAALLDGLSPEQWGAPTLCDAWRVRDVVAHVIGFEELGVGGMLARAARCGPSPDALNARRVAELADVSTEELVATVRRNLRPRGLTAMFGGRIGVTDGMIHQQDVRRPLGMPRVIPPERLRVTLEFARWAPPVGARSRIRGLRLAATDVDWSTGDGPLVEGAGEALLMAMAGRRGVAHELDGPGRDTLAARIGG